MIKTSDGRVRLFTNEEFIKISVEKHSNIYDYSLVDYKGSKDKVDVVCKLHGLFKITAGKHIAGHGCVGCSLNRTVLTGDEYVPKGAKIIPLTRGEYTIVDEEDYEELSKFYWHVEAKGYARTLISGKLVKMHRLLLNLTDPSKLADHINHDKLDNRKSNLRECTHQQNMYNRRNLGGVSNYKGVCKAGNKWRARICTGEDKRLEIGSFDTQEEAALAYNEQAILIFKEFAYLNVIDGK